MIREQRFKGVIPFYADNNGIICALGNVLFKYSKDLKSKVKVGYYNQGVVKNILAKSNFGSRIGRLGFHSVVNFKGGIVGIQRGNIVFKKKEESIFKCVFSEFRGSRPLNLCISPLNDTIYFGEYFSNKNREEVRIFESNNGIDWKVKYKFEPNTIRHIHGIFYDEFRKGLWVLTGDSDKESGLWFSNDNLKTLEKVFGGNQKARAVEIIAKKDGLIVPMDSPLEMNSINFFSLKESTITPLHQLNGSAFHAKEINGISFVSTVTEPSEINKNKSANVYASLDGVSWKCIKKFPKDFVPIRFQWLTRYAEISVVTSDSDKEFIYGYARAVKGGCFMFRWSTSEIHEYLSK